MFNSLSVQTYVYILRCLEHRSLAINSFLNHKESHFLFLQKDPLHTMFHPLSLEAFDNRPVLHKIIGYKPLIHISYRESTLLLSAGSYNRIPSSPIFCL